MSTLTARQPVPAVPEKQHEILRAILAFTEKHQYAPTFQELANLTAKSKTAVQNNVRDLERSGLLTFSRSTARSIIVNRRGRLAAAREPKLIRKQVAA